MTTHADIVAFLQANRAGADWSLSGDDLEGLTWSDETQPVPTQADLDAWIAGQQKRDLLDYVAAKRRTLAGGSATITSGGRSFPVWIDSESRTALLGILPLAQSDANFTLPNWKGADGNFYDLSAADVIAMWQGGLAFINECFAAEKALGAEIEAGTVTTTSQIDAASWPSP